MLSECKHKDFVNKIKEENGSALLVVVIVMFIVLLMSSVMFGYSLKTFKMTAQSNDLAKAELMADSAVAESLQTLLDKIDNVEIIESYLVTNMTPFPTDSEYHYETMVYEDGFYDSADFVTFGNVKSYTIQRSVVSGEELIFENIAFDIKAYYKDAVSKKKVLITINTRVDDYFEVMIYTCRN